jgi:predicted nucleic acid-binding protein
VIFLDTNIWLYGYTDEDDRKHRKAVQLAALTDVVLSSQIINELVVNLLRKKLISEQSLRELVHELYADYQILPLIEEDIMKASSLREKYRFSYWDSLIVACSLRANCQLLYSEDMQHQLVVDGKLRIVNPFV